MAWPTCKSALSFGDYLEVLRQLQRSASRPQSVLAVRLRSHGQVEARRSHLAVAERVAAVPTAEQRRAGGRAGWPERERLAAAAGTPLGEVDRLVLDFDAAAEVAGRYLRSGPWGRLRLLAEADPLLAWLGG